MAQLKLSQIWIYPIKSLGGISLPSTKVMEKGLPYDRRWMLVDANNHFMTQRQFPAMSQFHLSQLPGSFRIQHRTNSIDLPKNSQPTANVIRTKVWNDEVDTLEMDEKFNQWFSAQLGITCKLVYFPEHHPRPVDENYRVSGENVSLADAYPFLMIGQSTLDDLNSRLERPVEMKRFRPNFVFTGGQPFEEDSWKSFKIGSNRFLGVKPCSRCVLTTIDPATGELGKEPLATLSTYRKKENKIYFGQNLLAVDHGEIFEGDVITF